MADSLIRLACKQRETRECKETQKQTEREGGEREERGRKGEREREGGREGGREGEREEKDDGRRANVHTVFPLDDISNRVLLQLFKT